MESDSYKMRSDLYSVNRPSKYMVGTSTHREAFSSDENILLRDQKNMVGAQGIVMTRTVHVSSKGENEEV